MSIASPNASSDAAAAAAVDSSAAACGAKNAAWRSAVGTICYVPYKYAFNPELIVWNANRVHAFILANWHFSFLAVAVYIALIHALRAHMQSRKPLELRTPLLIWNLALAVFSTFGALRIGEEAAHVFMRRGLHDTICVSCRCIEKCCFITFICLLIGHVQSAFASGRLAISFLLIKNF